MREFAEFQQKAKQLATRFAQIYGQHIGCLSFFSILVPNRVAMDDATTISMLAQSLDETYDLIQYIRYIKRDQNLTLDDFNEFRNKAIVGIYLLKWFQYNSMTSSYMHNALIDLFRNHLEVATLEEVDKDFFNSCLNELSYYCTFVYSKRNEEPYSDLNKQLGATIQKDIHEVRYLVFNNDSSLYGLCMGIISSLGKCMY